MFDWCTKWWMMKCLPSCPICSSMMERAWRVYMSNHINDKVNKYVNVIHIQQQWKQLHVQEARQHAYQYAREGRPSCVNSRDSEWCTSVLVKQCCLCGESERGVHFRVHTDFHRSIPRRMEVHLAIRLIPGDHDCHGVPFRGRIQRVWFHRIGGWKWLQGERVNR